MRGLLRLILLCPLDLVEFCFVDVVTLKSVYRWRDQNDNYYLATNKWGFGQVPVNAGTHS